MDDVDSPSSDAVNDLIYLTGNIKYRVLMCTLYNVMSIQPSTTIWTASIPPITQTKSPTGKHYTAKDEEEPLLIRNKETVVGIGAEYWVYSTQYNVLKDLIDIGANGALSEDASDDVTPTADIISLMLAVQDCFDKDM